jgi:TPR repeat protein
MNEKELEKLFDTGCDHYEAGEKVKAFTLWKEAAEQGYVKAQHLVGFCYYWGLGTQKDKSLALEWYQKAAEKEYPQSICYLAEYYEHGMAGIERNTDEAVRLWKKAAKLGDKEAPFILGNLYYDGVYVEQDKKEAVLWYRMSAQRLNMNAMRRMKEIGERVFIDNEKDKCE